MAKLTDFQAIADEFRKDIALVIAEIKDLNDKLMAGGMTSDEEDAARATMQAQLDALEAIVAPPAPPAV